MAKCLSWPKLTGIWTGDDRCCKMHSRPNVSPHTDSLSKQCVTPTRVASQQARVLAKIASYKEQFLGHPVTGSVDTVYDVKETAREHDGPVSWHTASSIICKLSAAQAPNLRC